MHLSRFYFHSTHKDLKTILRQIFTVALVVLGVQFSLQAQNLSNLRDLKVDNLSDAQLEQLVKRAEASGLNQSQLEALAREQGLSSIELGKLRARLNGFRPASQNSSLRSSNGKGRSGELFEIGQSFDSLSLSDPYYDLTPFQKKIFGFKVFHNRNLDFNPSLNIPTPSNYVIGAGDQLLLDVYGASQQSFDLTVSPEGRVFIPNVGPVQVGGNTIEAAITRLKNSLGRIFSGMLGGNPNTFLQVRLGNIRSIKVAMVGELANPGTYTLPSFASVFNGLYAAGGPNENGAFRNIQVYRNNRLVAKVDVYEVLINGNQNSNITLQDNDVVIVPPVQTRVEVIGPVRREGLFEVKQGESVNDLLKFSGGFSAQAYAKRITIRRFDENSKKVLDVPEESFGRFDLKDGDEIIIGEILDRFTNRVQISGAVVREGEFALEDGLTIKSLLEKAEGLKPEAFATRATLYRTNTDLTLAAESIDLAGIISGELPDVRLKNEDLLFVPSRYDIQEEFFVKISGDVNLPGTYPFASNMTVGDLILRSGGLLQSASNSSIEIARRSRDASSGKIAEILTLTVNSDLSLSEDEKNVSLKPFDHIFIRRSPGFEREQLVSVTGEVVFPGEFAISNANERISDVIKRAGGVNQFAYPKGASLIRRTVYFKTKTDDEIKAEILKEIRTKLNPEKNRPGNQAEQLLYERLDEKITEAERIRIENEQRLAEERLNQNLLLDSAYLDSAVTRSRFKEQDLVGIDLEAILKNPGGPEDLFLQEGDIIQIPKELQTVRIVGEVLLPTTSRYIKTQGLKAYISRAGGFSEKARRSKSYVVYANGDAKRTHSVFGIKFYPTIEPGAEIVVPEKPQRERMSAAGWIGIASSLATLGILIERLVQ